MYDILTLPNGVRIVTSPMANYRSAALGIWVGAGSRQESAEENGATHFIEHMAFKGTGRRTAAQLAEEMDAAGGQFNAFTTKECTCFHARGLDTHLPQATDILTDMFFCSKFDEKDVQMERGVIIEEIGMYEDNPESKIFDLLMQNMYRNHPVRTPILGTTESIARITPEILTECHNAFYRPGNMLLCVVGDVDMELVRRIALQTLPEKAPQEVSSCLHWPEEMTCPKAYAESKMEVAMPMFQLGFKCEAMDRGEEAVKIEVIGDLAAEALFGESSRLYLRLYEEGLIDSAFGGGFETIEGMAMLTAFGDSDDPEAVFEAILEEGARLAAEGIPEMDFLRMKRSALGRRIRSLDSFDSTCFRICAYHFSGFDYFRFPEVYEKLDRYEVQEFLRNVVTRQRASLACIYPTNQEETT